MANRTVKDAMQIKGTNPQHLVEKIIRSRIYECRYWKEECFGLTAELIVDKAMDLKYIGGVYSGNVKPTPFLCLVLKMLQIAPEKDIIIEFIRNEDFKYVRFLGAFYMRLTGTSLNVYKYLEPLYVDYRKMKRLNRQGKFELVHMDELIDDLLRIERVCDIAMPRLQKRQVLEELNQLEIKISPLEENLDEINDDSSSMEEEEKDISKKVSSMTSPKHESLKRKEKHRSRSRERSKYKKYIDYDNPKEDDYIERSTSRHKTHKKSHKHKRSRSKSKQRSQKSKKHKKNRDHKSRHSDSE